MVKFIDIKIGDVCRIKHGYAFKSGYFSNKGKYLVLTPGNFKPEGGIIIQEGKAKYYSNDFPKEYILKKGDIVVVMTDILQSSPILGSPGIIKEDNRFLHNQRLGKVMDIKTESMLPEFLYWIFNSRIFRETIKGSATGATVKHTAPERIYAVKVKIPKSKGIQKKIASILSAHDDLIEANEQKIKILEAMAQLIYKEWFVKFRFPGYEKVNPVRNSNQLLQGSKISNGVKMVQSELGMIPEGWKVKRFTDVIEINPPLKIESNISSPFIDMKDLLSNTMVVKITKTKKSGSGSKFQNKDILFARITPCLENGKIGFVQCLDEKQVGLGSTEFLIFRSKTLCQEFVYLLARTNSLRQHAIKSMIGASGRQRVQKDCFEEYKLAVPSNNILCKFESLIVPLFELAQKLSEVNTKLNQTRNMLLPKLISGKIDVPGLNKKRSNTKIWK